MILLIIGTCNRSFKLKQVLKFGGEKHLLPSKVINLQMLFLQMPFFFTPVWIRILFSQREVFTAPVRTAWSSRGQKEGSYSRFLPINILKIQKLLGGLIISSFHFLNSSPHFYFFAETNFSLSVPLDPAINLELLKDASFVFQIILEENVFLYFRMKCNINLMFVCLLQYWNFDIS